MPDFEKAKTETLLKWETIKDIILDLDHHFGYACGFCQEYKFKSEENKCPAVEVCGICTYPYRSREGSAFEKNETPYSKMHIKIHDVINSILEMINRVKALEESKA